jgi:phage tail tape-measure protein
VDGRHGLYLCDGSIHDGPDFRVFIGMLAQQAGYALKMVFDAMVDFPHHGIAQTHRVVRMVAILGLMQ